MVRRACRGRARARRRAAGASGGSLGRRLRAPCNPHAALPPQVPRAPLAPAQARLLRAEGVHCVGAGRVGGAQEAARRVAAGAGGGGDRVAGAHGSREPRHAFGQAAPPRLDQDDGRDLQLAVRRGADRVRHPGRAAPARGDQAAGQGGAEALGEGQAHQHEAAALARCCRARPGAARCGRARAGGRARGRGLLGNAAVRPARLAARRRRDSAEPQQPQQQGALGTPAPAAAADSASRPAQTHPHVSPRAARCRPLAVRSHSRRLCSRTSCSRASEGVVLGPA